MGFQLVIAEKPSVAHSIARVIGAGDQKDGYLEGNGYLVNWCFGHLIELAEPQEYDSLLQNMEHGESSNSSGALEVPRLFWNTKAVQPAEKADGAKGCRQHCGGNRCQKKVELKTAIQNAWGRFSLPTNSVVLA